MDRTDPPFSADELTMLTSWLEYHRATLALKCGGLTDDQLRARSVEPSSMSLLGLVRHMADVERNWFRNVLHGEGAPGIYFSDAEPDGEFDLVDGASVADAFATWEAQCANARAVVAEESSLDVIGKGSRHGDEVSLRWILVHMIEEYARHNGHADLLRERIDGAVGD